MITNPISPTALLVIALTFVTNGALFAQNDLASSERRVSIPDTEIHAIHSEVVGDDFELWIARPQAGFVPIPDGPVRVLYVLDANLFFGTAVEMTRIMHKLFGELPPLLVVGVAYPTDNSILQGLLRTRDFTPSVDERMAAMSASFPQLKEVPRVEPAMGGADAFRLFLENEVKPFVHARYDVREDGATIFGSSLGGLFVAHTFLTAPATFENFIAVSPALWWNQDEIFGIVPGRTKLSPERPANVFVAAGGFEESPDIPGLTDFKMITNARRMAELLTEDAETSLNVHFEQIDGETHTSVVPAALTRGLRQVLRDPQPAN